MGDLVTPPSEGCRQAGLYVAQCDDEETVRLPALANGEEAASENSTGKGKSLMTADDLWPNWYWYLYNRERREVHEFWDNVEFYDSETMALSRARNRPKRRKG